MLWLQFNVANHGQQIKKYAQMCRSSYNIFVHLDKMVDRIKNSITGDLHCDILVLLEINLSDDFYFRAECFCEVYSVMCEVGYEI